MNKNITMSIITSLLIVACSKQESAPHTHTEPTASAQTSTHTASETAASVDLVTASHITPTTHVTSWHGEYTGTLPCADCDGIKTELFLFKNRTYKLKNVYLGKSERPLIVEGKLSLKNDEFTIITLYHQNEKTMYQVRGNQLIALDQEGHEIEGALASQYVLEKVKPVPREV
ncbi:copper resistance protein NlpE N-terminal domain-containing protein [Acinetobacter apis]|uniref:Uncharacterized lipoprotein NlpE involved in copper resistance n=1 Tax=Acinetobacter apis TaxID=1229165 RepID=A0A217EFR7_9GAMM|nr:copper resistance protein NlpE [Acinetobacter apis]SNQ29338.1 Uncharacterized lipoprotein NlpE involved in copper resistance [Acinetobacter apis]